ncbi:MAG: hypothetical protein ABH867_04905 [Patescibacteria group bacterium]
MSLLWKSIVRLFGEDPFGFLVFNLILLILIGEVASWFEFLLR